MRILVWASAAPLPPLDGFRLLLTALVRELRADHEVRVVAPLRPGQRPDSDPDLVLVDLPVPPPGWAVGAAPRQFLRGRPLRDDQLVAASWPAVRAELERFQPDLVHVTSGRLAPAARRLDGRPSLLGAIDARHLNVRARADAATGVRRLALRDEARRARRIIGTEYHRFGHVTVVTEEDRQALLEVDANLDVTVVPNGVDVDHWRPDGTRRPVPDRIVFTGSMRYAPNVATATFLATDVLPRVQQSRPEATLCLVGRDPAPEVRQLEALPGVTVTGEVPDVRPWLHGSSVFAAPMTSGTGIKNKLLEAMACGIACVVSPLALQGISARDGNEVVVARAADEVAREVTALLDDPERTAALGSAARAHVVANHSWAAVAATHVDCYEQVLAADTDVDAVA